MKNTTRLLALTALFIAIAAPSAHATVPAGYTQTTLTTGLNRPVALAFLPDGRLLVGEQFTGDIHVIKNGVRLATPFGRLFPVYGNSNETGLIGLAVDPAFATNGWVYAMVTETNREQKVYRFTAQGDVGTARTQIITSLPTSGINHNGGGIAFGPDGKLYVSVGDNGNFPNDAQSTTSRRGKLLRYNKDGTVASGNPYGATNPAFCIGLRNTYRFCFQAGTGKIFATENGPNGDDEINVLEAGKNYGWPQVTGINGDARYRDPIAEFPSSIAPTGIVAYAGAAMPALQGQILFASYLDDKIMRGTVGAGGTTLAISDFVTNVRGPIDLAQAPDGSIAISTDSGSVVKVTAAAAPSNQLPSASFTFTPSSGVAPIAVTFDGSGSTDPDGSIATYSWDFGDGLSGTGARPAHTYALPGNFAATLTVTDNRGGQGRTTRTIVITSSPTSGPASAHIERPADGSSHAALMISFEGHGHAAGQIVEHDWDFGDGTPGTHFHTPGTDVNTTAIHTFAAPGTYSVSLTVEDDQGQTDTDTIVVTVGTGGTASTVVATYATQRFEWRSAYSVRSQGTYGEYVLRLDAGRAYEIATSQTVAGTSDDPYLYVVDASTSRVLAQDDDSNAAAAGPRDAKIAFTPPATADYKIRLRAYTRNRSGTTNLTVTTQGGSLPPPVAVPAIRPGDVLNSQTFEWRTASATRPEGRYAEYKLVAAAGTTYTIETSSAVGGGEDTFLYVVDGQERVVAQDDDGGGAYLSRIVWTPATAGDYFVRLRAYERGQSGTCTLACRSSTMTPGNPLYPDLITWVTPNYMRDAYIVTESGRKLLRFSNAIANRGAGPLELYGVVNATTGSTDAFQVVHHDNGARVTHHVGTFSFAGHATHNHWHFDEFAIYELRSTATGALVKSSDKVSFCLLDLARYTAESVPGAAANSIYDCSNQGISVGWADVYSAGLEGQYIDITGVADGTYKLVSITDPNNRLHEEPSTNNRAELTIEIRGMRATIR